MLLRQTFCPKGAMPERVTWRLGWCMGQVWVLDSPLGTLRSDPGRPSDTDRVIAEIASIPLPVPSRRWLYEHMTAKGYSEAIQHWLGSNLVPADGQGSPNGQGLKWAFDITGTLCHAGRSPQWQYAGQAGQKSSTSSSNITHSP